MDVLEAISRRRAYRSLEPITISDELVSDLASKAQLAPSCFNNQPTRFVFVYEQDMLLQVKETLTKSNAWAKAASMIIAVFGKPDMDCRIKGRDYYLFDLGQTSAFLQLRATELGLVAHPIAGFDEDAVKNLLNIPQDMMVITLIIVGRKSNTLNPVLSEDQIAKEKTRPERLPLEEIVFLNRYE
jgi:nitroreductase